MINSKILIFIFSSCFFYCLFAENKNLNYSDISYVRIYQTDYVFPQPKELRKKNILSILKPISPIIKIKVTDLEEALFSGYNFTNARRDALPWVGDYFYYVFFDKNNNILFSFKSSKLWKKSILYVELKLYKNNLLRLDNDINEWEIKNQSIYKYLMNIYDNTKINKLPYRDVKGSLGK